MSGSTKGQAADTPQATLIKTIENERTKYFAAALDRGSTAIATTGIATPTVTWLLNLGKVRDWASPWELAAFIAMCAIGAIGLHLIGRHVLGRLL